MPPKEEKKKGPPNGRAPSRLSWLALPKNVQRGLRKYWMPAPCLSRTTRRIRSGLAAETAATCAEALVAGVRPGFSAR